MINNYKPYYLKIILYAAEDFLFNNREEAPTQNQTIAAKSVPVLVYHGLIAKPDKVSTSLEEFKDDMFALKTAGYQTVRLADFQAYIQGKKTLPDKSFLLTFDDARKDSYYPADPILKELHYSAVMFVITDTLDSKTNRFHLTKSELIKMKNSGRWS